MKTYTVKIIWADGIWYTSTDKELGLVLESASFDNLVERVRLAVPEMLELNSGYTGEFELIFEAVRKEQAGQKR